MPINQTGSVEERPSHLRYEIAGWLLLAMLICTLLRYSGGDSAMWLSGIASWAAAVLLWPRIPTRQRIQMIVIVSIGLLFALWGSFRGASVSMEQALGQNQVILAMLAAVSFLKLVNRPIVEGEAIPSGRASFARTLFGVHIFGAAINFTAMVMFADRLAAQARFKRLHALMLTRGFCLSALYSPFIGGMGLALALTPGSRLESLALAGVPLSIFGLLVTYFLLARMAPSEVAAFKGYPIRLESLWLPAVLAVCVALIHRMYPAFSVLALISILAPLLVATILVYTRGWSRSRRALTGHVRHTLPNMSGELLLFLSAGILAAGLTSVFSSFGDWTPFARFDAWAASATLSAMVALSIAGIHPIVCVSFLAPLLAPISPEPNLLALVFVSGWAIGCTLSPFSGTNLTMQGRYGISSWSITMGNLGYGFIMLMACCLAFLLVAQ